MLFDTNGMSVDLPLNHFDRAIGDTNFSPAAVLFGEMATNTVSGRLALAHYLNTMRQPEKAEPLLIGLLADDNPASIQKSALLELAVSAQTENDLPKAQSIYEQYRDKWPSDERTPEILLHQGQVFRQMGLNDLALQKFYSVMTTALSLRDDRLDYYQRIVLQAQLEIADTQYLAGKFADSAEFYSRILQKSDPSLDRAQIQFRLIRSLTLCDKNSEAVAQAQDFLSRFSSAPEEPEVRYDLAQGLKALGRNSDALQQVLLLLQEQKVKTAEHPEVWIYWQQRLGNEIANELYKEGDYMNALQVYLNLVQLNPTPKWQLPIYYQMGVTYERLLQPEKAAESYNQIISREADLATNIAPDLKTVIDMAKWRADFLKWQGKAQIENLSLAAAAMTNAVPKP